MDKKITLSSTHYQIGKFKFRFNYDQLQDVQRDDYAKRDEMGYWHGLCPNDYYFKGLTVNSKYGTFGMREGKLYKMELTLTYGGPDAMKASFKESQDSLHMMSYLRAKEWYDDNQALIEELKKPLPKLDSIPYSRSGYFKPI